jgi:hypothetical protein
MVENNAIFFLKDCTIVVAAAARRPWYTLPLQFNEPQLAEFMNDSDLACWELVLHRELKMNDTILND